MGNMIRSRPGNRLATMVGNRARRIMGNRVRDLLGERRENLTVFAKTSPIKATAKLVIKDFEEVMKGNNPGVKYDSNTFMVGDTPMAMTVYPNGFLQDDRGYVSVYLCNNSTADIPVKCQFSCDAGSLSLDDKVLANQALGSRRFLSHAECSVHYTEREFVMEAKVEVAGKGVKSILENKTPSLPKKYCVCKNLYEKMERSDFNLIFKGVEVPCHKHVLSAASPVLAAMVENKHLEAVEGKAKIDVSAEVGKAFVRFLYTGELEDQVFKEEAVVFLELGDKYNVQGLKDLAETELLSQLEKTNMVSLVSIGDLYNAKEVFEAALEMTKANLPWLHSQVCTLYTTPEIDSVEIEHVAEIGGRDRERDGTEERDCGKASLDNVTGV